MRLLATLSASLAGSLALACSASAAGPDLPQLPAAAPLIELAAQKCTCVRYEHPNPKVRRCVEQKCVTVPDPPRCQSVCVAWTGFKIKRCVRRETRCN